MFRNENDMAEEDVMDTVRLQKLFRKLQRQVHSPEHQVVIQVAEQGIQYPIDHISNLFLQIDCR